MLFGSAVILAGGQSRRMPFDKQLLQINHQRLIEQQITTLKTIFPEIIIVSNTPEYYSDYRVTVISDEIKNHGPLSGLHCGLKKASHTYVYFLACDMPQLNVAYIQFMMQKLQTQKALACVTKYQNWIEPFNAFYAQELYLAIENNLNQSNLNIFQLLKNIDCQYISEVEARRFSPDWAMFANLNSPADLVAWLEAKDRVK